MIMYTDLARGLALALGLLVVGCSHQTESTYAASEVGEIIETSQATVLAGRVVAIDGQGEQSGYGPALGAATLGTAGYYITDGITGGTGSAAVAVIAGLVGAGLGWAAENSADSREGIEYILRTEAGRDVTVVQNREGEESPLAPGTPVLLQQGTGYVRVVPLPPGV
jgi:outer membrane lipoprotein SlyB